MNWLMMILKLIPYVSAGIQTVHADLPVEGKVKAAQDSLAIAVAGAQQVLAPDNAELATAIGTAVNNSISQVVTSLHNAALSTAIGTTLNPA